MRTSSRKSIVIPAIVFTFLFSSQGAFGQESSSFFLDTVSIATSRIDQSSSATGRNITVIEAEEIRKLPVNSLDDLLRYLPGVQVSSRGGFGAQSDFSIRGSTFNQVLVLVDQVRINDPLTGHFNSYIPIALAEIARVEVLRGPAAALYGPDAVGGVIHIITRTFENKYKALPNELRGDLLTGQYGLVKGQVGVQMHQGNWNVGAGVLVNTSDGQTLPSGLKSDFNTQTYSASAGYRGKNGWQAALRTGYDLRTFNAQYFYTASTADQSREQTIAWWNQGRVAHVGKNSRTSVDFAYKMSQDSFLFNPAFAANVHTMHSGLLQVHHVQQLNTRWSLAFGGQADRRSIVSTDRGNHQTNHAGIYAIGAYQGQHLSANGSFRVDADQNYGVEATPQLNLSYREGIWIFRGAVGRAIRAADFTERYVSNNLPAPISGGRNLGNPDLQAERSWSYEIGTDVAVSKIFTPRFTAFMRNGRNLIDYVLTPASEIANNANLTPGANYLYTLNLSEVTLRGLEVEAWMHIPLAGKQNINGVLGYTLLRSQTADGVISKYISNHARDLITAQLTWAGPAWSIGVQGLYKNRNPDAAAGINAELKPSYSVWHLQGSWFFLNRQFGVTGQVQNIFNASYSDILGAQMPSRWFLGGISWKWMQRQ